MVSMLVRLLSLVLSLVHRFRLALELWEFLEDYRYVREQHLKNHVLAKLFGWLQFATNTAGQIAQSGSAAPHGWAAWLQFAASLAAAVGIHAASNTGGPNTPAQ